MMYYLKDGSFSHKLNAEANPNATVQSFYSLVAYVRMFDGRGSLFVLDKNEEIPVTDDKKDDTHDKESGNTGTDNSENDKKETEDLEKDIMEAENEEGKNSENEIRIDKTESSSVKGSYKKYVIGGLIILAAIICIILSILKKHIKNHIFVLILTLAGILFVILTDFSSVDTYYSDTGKKDDTFGMVTMSIRCDILNGKNTDEHIPKDGCILDTTEFEISRGDTAYDVLLEAAKKYSISVEHEGSSELAYISGINFLYEHDFGDLSGWVYKVNGELPSVGCAGYVLKDKDVIEWCYTLDLGNDTMK
ncbi:MAG: DUF4430 domain-containing protein [Lachnospiraceae bacterium]|nr:DUF4430 domain-containing protein [Lachnospiraceae bacterium]